MRQKGQKFIYNDDEISLIKNTFADNEELIYLIRNVLLQFEVSKEEKKLLSSILKPEVVSVLKKRIFPEISKDAPLDQLSDLNKTLNGDIKTKSVEDMEAIFEAKELQIEYMREQFARLSDLNSEPTLSLADMGETKGKDPKVKYVETLTRNFILPYVDNMLMLIQNIAGQKTETVEEAKKRLDRDSNK